MQLVATPIGVGTPRRIAGETCVGAFMPSAVGLPRQERHLKYRWDGAHVDRYFGNLRDASVPL
jgi:hypothetical protein